MTTAMARLKTHFTEIQNKLGMHYKIFSLTGKDEKVSLRNDSGVTKAVNSDFIKIFKPVVQANEKKAESFSFAINNYERAESGLIVTLKNVEKDDLRAYYTFSEFKPLMNTFVKELKNLDTKNFSLVADLVKTTFKLTNEEIKLGSFLDEMVEDLKDLEAQYLPISKEFDAIIKKRTKVENAKEAGFKDQLKQINEERLAVVERLTAIREQYRERVATHKVKVMEEKPYLSSRLLAKILNKDIRYLEMSPYLKSDLHSVFETEGLAGLVAAERLSD